VRTERKIRRFIERELLEEPYAGADPLADELLDSLGIEQLIEHLEKSYRITFDESELIYENFVSVAVLANLVDDKRKRAATAH
jgi:acyl carrier protein